MGLSYKTDVLTALIADCVTSKGRGAQTRLAEAVGVEVQTVNKWVHGQTHPTPDKWDAIEDFFELPRGEIASRVVPRGATTTAEEVDRLNAVVVEMGERVAAMENTLREVLRQVSRRR